MISTSRSERLLLWCTAAVALALRVVALLHYRFDSDEQQHLHVAWGWTARLVQYRDVFDNHAPLFHLLTAPFLLLLGERPEILLWMRVPMVPVLGVVLWCTWLVARDLYDARTAAWAVALLTFFPPFFLKSLEYRPDNLWTMLWMIALLLFLRGRAGWAGFVLGIALAVSVKTVVLVAAVAGASLLMARVDRPALRRAILPFLLVPAAIVSLFLRLGAWDELLYCNFTFNSRLALTRSYLWIGRAAFPFLLAAVVAIAWKTRGRTHPWRWFASVVAGLFTATVVGFWPLISPRDFLPLMPIAAIFGSAALLQARRAQLVLAATLVVMAATLLYYADGFRNHTRWHVTMMHQVLRLTRPGEMLLDVKGETIYRRRPFYPALEVVTRELIAHGVLADTIEQDVIRTRTYIVQADGPMWPPAGRDWLSNHFVNLGRLRGAGHWVSRDGSFPIGVPGEYAMLDNDGEAHGILDGTPYTGPRVLAAGPHRFLSDRETCALWAPAWRRGHSPFHLRDLEF